MTSPPEMALKIGPWSLCGGLFIFFLLMFVLCTMHGDWVKWEGWVLKPQINCTGWLTKSVRNRSVIERICSVFV